MAVPTCVSSVHFQANVEGGVNTSVLIRNNCNGSTKAQAEYKSYANGSITYHWGPCATISGGGGTWSSQVYYVNNWSGNGQAWTEVPTDKAKLRTC